MSKADFKKISEQFDPANWPKLSPDEAKREFDVFMAKLEKDLEGMPKEALQSGAQKVLDFIHGKLSWAEIFNIPKHMLKEMVEYGYLQFQMGRYEDAERFFKVLTVLDWENPYYHSMMGSILQRQKRYGEAIAEYSEAVKINQKDFVSLTNRAEIYFQHKMYDDAAADCDQVLGLNLEKENKWLKRAQLMTIQIKERTKGKPQGAVDDSTGSKPESTPSKK